MIAVLVLMIMIGAIACVAKVGMIEAIAL